VKTLFFVLMFLLVISIYSVNESFSQGEDFKDPKTLIGKGSLIASDCFDPETNTFVPCQTPVESKIHQTLIGWQTSSDPATFATANNLSFSNNKIKVYVYLDSAESISNIPQDIDVVDSNGNIAVALVSSEQIDQLSLLDFVEKIEPPILVQNPPLPIPKSDEVIEGSMSNEIVIGVGIVIVIAIGVGVFSLRRRKLVQHS